MKKIWKNISAYALVALISIGATYGTYSYLNDNKKSQVTSDSYNYGNEFNQKGVHLVGLTSDGYPDFTKAAENSIHAVVHIKSTVQAQSSGRQRMVDPFEFFFGDRGGSGRDFGTPRQSVGFGSGVIISNDGYIITNNHVIDKATEIEVTLNDNRKFTAKLIGADPVTDIALLKIEGKDFSYVPFGDSDKLKVGEWVLAVGNPFNLTSTVTAGIVSAKGRGGIGMSQGGQQSIQSFIQTDAAINRGNSGGALVNTNGELVGINTAIYSQTGDFAGYGFAVPISIAGKVVADLKEYGTVQRAVLGVVIADVSVFKESEPGKAKDIKANDGAYVVEFQEISPAKQAGIEEGDVITEINGVSVKSVSQLQDQVNRYRPGDKIKVQVMRGNNTRTFDVTLKNNSGNTSVVKKEDGIAVVGASFKELSDEKKKEFGLRHGVEVTGVDNKGKFHNEGIRAGFIILELNNQPVSTASEVETAIQRAANSERKVLFISGINANGSRKYYAIPLGSE